MTLFTGYILPFLAFAILVAALALRVHWLGGPGMMVVVFLAVAFGPSLLYAVIADDSNINLFTGSLLAALAVTGFMIYRRRKANT